jgi:hypothetical protein
LAVVLAGLQSCATQDRQNGQQCGNNSPHYAPVFKRLQAVPNEPEQPLERRIPLLRLSSRCAAEFIFVRSITAVSTAVSNLDQHCEPAPKRRVAEQPFPAGER